MQTEGWERNEWPTIKRLLRDYGYNVIEDPVWADPGVMVYWQNSPIIIGYNDDGTVQGTIDNWQKVPLPATTAAQVAAYLKRGLRITERGGYRTFDPNLENPPRTGPIYYDPEPKFTCKHDKEQYKFATWDSYLNHINHFGEPVNTDQVPTDIWEKAEASEYYCLQHNLAFPNERGARSHLRDVARRGEKYIHPTVNAMKGKKK